MKLKDFPEFRVLAAARFLFSLAMQAQAVSIGWLVYDMTHDPLYLGLVGLAEAIPAIALALLAGHWVDRGRPYVFYRYAILFCCLNSVLMAAASIHPTSITIVVLFLSIFATGVARSFVGPSLFSLIPRTVPRTILATSSTWLSCVFQIAAITGPALGGLIYASLGKIAALLFVSILSFISFALLSQLGSAVKSYRCEVMPSESATQSIRSGLHFVFHQKVVLSALSLDMFSVLFGGTTAVLPAISLQILHTDAFGLGLLRAAPAMGAVIVTLALIRSPLRRINGKTLLVAVAGFGICMLGLGISRSIGLSLVLLAASGAFDAVSMVIRSTLLQLNTPDGMRGRVSAVNSVFVGSSNEIGAFESGTAARFLGLAPSIIFGGAMTLLVVLATTAISPELARAEISK